MAVNFEAVLRDRTQVGSDCLEQEEVTKLGSKKIAEGQQALSPLEGVRAGSPGVEAGRWQAPGNHSMGSLKY